VLGSQFVSSHDFIMTRVRLCGTLNTKHAWLTCCTTFTQMSPGGLHIFALMAEVVDLTQRRPKELSVL
jgi:hypothetical protein